MASDLPLGQAVAFFPGSWYKGRRLRLSLVQPSIERKEFSMSPWLKAGLVGAGVLVVLDLVGLIPCVACVTLLLGIVAYLGIGMLAAYWMPPPRVAGTGAGQGALAAVLAALIGGSINTIIFTIQMAVADTAAIMSQIPAESLQQLEELGIDPSALVGPGAGVAYGSVCCLVGLILAAILGAVGGAIFAGLKSD
jgi:hypothetical protein